VPPIVIEPMTLPSPGHPSDVKMTALMQQLAQQCDVVSRREKQTPQQCL